MVEVIGIAVAIGLYFLGVHQGKHQETSRREHELLLERERREHDLAMEALRRHRERVEKVVDEFVEIVRKHLDGGPHALATLGLHQLGSDQAIREAVKEMLGRTGSDPWAGDSAQVENVDLVLFFKYVQENRVNFFQRSVESVAMAVRDLASQPSR